MLGGLKKIRQERRLDAIRKKYGFPRRRDADKVYYEHDIDRVVGKQQAKTGNPLSPDEILSHLRPPSRYAPFEKVAYQCPDGVIMPVWPDITSADMQKMYRLLSAAWKEVSVPQIIPDPKMIEEKVVGNLAAAFALYADHAKRPNGTIRGWQGPTLGIAA